MPRIRGGLIGGLWAAAATAGAPALRLMLRRRAGRGKEVASRLPERFGRSALPRPEGRLLWLHAASVGETVSALPLLQRLPPGLHVLFTTGTVTSAALLEARLAQLGLERVVHQFVPLDVPAWAAQFLDHWRPDAACFLESELWPNLLAACRRRGIGVALVNARLSARSAARWSRVPGFARALLGQFDWIAAQSEADAARLRRLGARAVDAPGNLKLASPPLPARPARLAELRAAVGDRPRWLAASIHKQDDAMVAEAHRVLSARHPGLLTAIAPRHPDRGAALAATFGAPRLACGEMPAGGMWIADTIGELGELYRCFPVVMMGKSFGAGRDGGGQNPWEPGQLGCAVVCGPHMENFTEAVGRLRQRGGLVLAADAASLIETLDAWLSDPARARAAGLAARAATEAANDVAVLLAGRLDELAGGALAGGESERR